MNGTHITLKSYIIGFVLSLACTLCAYWVAVSPSFSSKLILIDVLILAFLQLITQLIFFLHLGKEGTSRYTIFIFGTTLIGICILVFGSLWIMNHLNNNMMSSDMTKFIINNEGIPK